MDKKVERSLFYSILDGSFWSVMFGLGERYLSAFAVFLRASNFEIGLLTSLPLLLGSLCQFFSLRLTQFFGSRKRFVVVAVLLQALVWVPILLVFFLGTFKVYYLILFAVVYWVAGMVAAPAWNSWMGDLVDAEHRGAYFGRRSKVIGLVVLVSTVVGGIVLDLFHDGADRQFLGFVAIFLAAMAARFFSAFFLSRKFEPAAAPSSPSDDFTFLEFLKQARFRNYGLFVIFLSLMNFSIFLASPFFAAYMLYDLKFSYVQYMVILSAGFITRFVSLPVWGRLCDEYGNRKVLTFTGYLMPVLPLLWVLSPSFYYIILLELYSGFAWAGFELSSFNFVFDTTTPQKRARCVSYFNMINGVLVFLGVTAGSLVVKYNALFWSKYYLVFILSCILRYSVSVVFLPKLKEVRNVAEISYERIFLKAADMIITESFSTAALLLSYPKRFKVRKHNPP